jgi:hypothetical protein
VNLFLVAGSDPRVIEPGWFFGFRSQNKRDKEWLMYSRKNAFVGLALLVLFLVCPTTDASAQKKRKERVIPSNSQPPTVRLASDINNLIICPGESGTVRLTATANSPQGLPLRYVWSASGGRITGDGAETTWDLTGVEPGTYTANIEVNSGREQDCMAFTSTTVVIRPCQPVCPTITIYCPDTVKLGAPVTFQVNATGGTAGITPSYNWTVSAGTITDGQGTNTITVDTAGLAGQSITAKVQVVGYNLDCSATCTTQVPQRVEPRKFDEFGNIARNDEKARLDNFAIQMQSEPEAQGYIIVYGGPRTRPGDVQKRVARIREYLVNYRGINSSRLTVLEGGQREDLIVELWLVPAGASPPGIR